MQYNRPLLQATTATRCPVSYPSHGLVQVQYNRPPYTRRRPPDVRPRARPMVQYSTHSDKFLFAGGALFTVLLSRSSCPLVILFRSLPFLGFCSVLVDSPVPLVSNSHHFRDSGVLQQQGRFCNAVEHMIRNCTFLGESLGYFLFPAGKIFSF